MPRGIASTKQVTMMASVLEAYCAVNNISDPSQRDDIAVRLLALFDGGARDRTKLMAGLIASEETRPTSRPASRALRR